MSEKKALLIENSRKFHLLVTRSVYAIILVHRHLFQHLQKMPRSVFIQRHAFHLVNPSPKPLITSFAALTTAVGLALHFHGYTVGFETALCGLSGLLLSIFLWWQDIVDEGSFEGVHTNIVQLSLRYGMILFILSEIMFFFAFFWAFFASSLTPAVEIGNI
jgi:cytochrome c oxidase subunit 3